MLPVFTDDESPDRSLPNRGRYGGSPPPPVDDDIGLEITEVKNVCRLLYVDGAKMPCGCLRYLAMIGIPHTYAKRFKIQRLNPNHSEIHARIPIHPSNQSPDLIPLSAPSTPWGASFPHSIIYKWELTDSRLDELWL